ncbi:MAG: transcriptional regulator [Chitinophagaceae bacterium]|nr:transcriptional regulator [Chitinophagaceae bacterium]
MGDYKKGFNRLNMILSIIKNNTTNLEKLTDLVNEKLIHDNDEAVSERTITRDIKVLKSKGYEILSKKGHENKNFYIIESEDDDLDLSENEIKTLPILMGLLKTEENLSITKWLKDKLKNEFNFSINELDPSPYFVKTNPSINFKEDLMLLTAEIIEYIKKGQVIYFEYFKQNNSKYVAPLQVRYYDGRYYLLGTEIDEDNDYKPKSLLTTYSIDNIVNLSVVPAIKEEPHNHGDHIFFDYKKLYEESHLEILLKNSFGIIYNSILDRNRIKKYRFKFTNWAISYVENKIFHPSQRVVEKTNDYIIIELTLWEIMDNYIYKSQGIEFWDNKEVDFFVGRFGDKCERLD